MLSVRRILSLALIALVVMGAKRTRAGEIGFPEQFALAKDRAAVLKQLIPGTEDYYFYNCLHLQNLQRFGEVEKLLPQWVERHGETSRYRQIVNRQHLLTYAADKEKSLNYLKQQLNLTFHHERPPMGEKPNLPDALDQNLISRDALLQRALQRHANLDGFEDRALHWLTQRPLDAQHRRNLLERLNWPDYPNLAKLVAEDLKSPNSAGFGSQNIHRLMLLSQLDELLRLMPELRNNNAFVFTYVSKLAPSRDVDPQVDPAIREAYLDRLWAFVSTLAPAFNSLKANILYHRLVHDRALGKWNKERFLAYLALPRNVHYVNPKYLEDPARQRYPVDLNMVAVAYTGLPPIMDDEALVRSYLMHFLVEAPNYSEFETWIADNYLREVFAETKILAGVGDPEQWYSLLPPDKYQALKDRVDLEFSFQNKQLFGVDDPVTIDVDVKNVKTLLVKVFEIRTGQYYRATGREIDTDINLDGLVAHEEKTYAYDLPPLRRERRRFNFPSIDKRGVYVIDFIGNGKSSRVLVRKGRLQAIVVPSPLGLDVLVLNEKQEHVKDATLWLDGQTYKADERGLISVPFTTAAGVKSVILSQGDFSSLAQIHLPNESYQLEAAMHVDRESLRTRKLAKIAIRPRLLVNGHPISLQHLEEPKLVISTVDLDGVAATKEVKALELGLNKEFVYDFQTPARLATLSVTLQGSAKTFLANESVQLSVNRTFVINDIDRSTAVDDFHLTKTAGGYVLECRGKTGELRPQIPFQLTLKHKDFREPVQVMLKTDDQGRTLLGELTDIAAITVPTRNAGPEAPPEKTWVLLSDQRIASNVIHAKAGDVIQVPYLGKATKPERSELSLVQYAGSAIVSEHFSSLAIENGFIVIKNLPAGDFELRNLLTGEFWTLRVSQGDAKFGALVGKTRQLQLRAAEPVHLVNVAANDSEIVAKVANANPTTRVHVIATRYQPAFSVLNNLGAISLQDLGVYYSPRNESAYVAGRKIGDEYQYILDRRLAKKFVGNMLERPSLLLNPWSIRKTESDQEELAEGGAFGRGGAPGAAPAAPAPSTRAPIAPQFGEFSNLDFLVDDPLVVYNLPVEEDGTVKIDRKALGEKHWVHVVVVDAATTTYRQLALEEAKSRIYDLRLAKALDAAKAYCEQRKISFIEKDGLFEIADISTAKLERYDDLAKVHRLLLTLSSSNPTLAEFSFVTTWASLKPEEKQRLYSQYACHELHFFLYKKDPEFFQAVVRPYLANKKDKTFLDHYLLESDLSRYASPWNYSQLNTVEKILLAQRISEHLEATRLLLRDQVEIIPINVELDLTRFKAALLLGAMDVSDSADLFGGSGAIREERFLGGMGGMGGMGAPGGRFGQSASGAANAPGAPPMVADELKELESRARDAAPARQQLGRRNLPALEEAQKQQASKRKSESLSDADDSKPVADAGTILLGGVVRRGDVQRPFVPLPPTEEWAENNYYKLRITQQVADLVQANRLWRDYVNQEPGKPFLSRHIADAATNFTEMMFALSVLDLPFDAPKHEEKVDGLKYTLKAGGPAILFHEGIFPAESKSESTPVLVSQNLFRADDRYQFVEGVQVDKFVTDEFLPHVVYGCRVVLTNPTSANQRLDVLTQIPEGALPVAGAAATRSVPVALGAYSTHQFEYFFYFPAAGDYPHYPAQVSRDGALLASAEARVLKVVEELKNFDRESWEYVSIMGTDDEVLAFLKSKNLQKIDLGYIAYRMKNAKFFADAIATLSSRRAYNDVLWSYGVYHDVPAVIREYLRHQEGFIANCGEYLDSPLLVLDPVERRTYEHLDYRPLVNARAHQVGLTRTILNEQLLAHYQRLMNVLSYRRELNDAEKMAVIYYLLLQDRVEESLQLFAEVDKSKLAEQLQYDYFDAYLKMYEANAEGAKAIADKYTSYPVLRWRDAFKAISQQVAEIQGAEAAVVDDKSREQVQAELAAKEPSFDFSVESRKIKVNHQNIAEITVNFYLMDLELLFSNNPFVQQGSGQFSFVRPNHSIKATIEKGAASTEIELPPQFHQSNVLVEVEAGGKTQTHAYYANSLTVQMLENYGQVRVTSPDQKPVAGAYVKVYSRNSNGSVKFFKDGYTDLRGRFDYASVSSNEVQSVERFAILIVSEKFGAVVREVNPPRR